jgi:hypothetical protein
MPGGRFLSAMKNGAATGPETPARAGRNMPRWWCQRSPKKDRTATTTTTRPTM